MKTLIAFAALACISSIAHADRIKFPAGSKDSESAQKQAPVSSDALMVSDRDLNRFVFPSPVKRVIFPAGAPVLGQPIYLAGNLQVLIQVSKGADSEFAMIVEGENGKVTSLRLSPRPVAGAIHRIDGARDGVAPRPAPKAAPQPTEGGEAGGPNAEAIAVLNDFAASALPESFEPQVLPKPVRFDKFTVVPLEAWSNGTLRVIRYSLIAVPGETAVVSQPQFYRDGVQAISLDGNVVDSAHTPTLNIVDEEVSY